MRLKQKDMPLTPEETRLTLDPEKRQLTATEINAKEAEKHFKDMPWAQVLITPTLLFFRN